MPINDTLVTFFAKTSVFSQHGIYLLEKTATNEIKWTMNPILPAFFRVNQKSVLLKILDFRQFSMEMTEYRKIAWTFSQNHCFYRFLYRFQRDLYQNNASICLLLSLLPTQNNEPSNATPFDLESYALLLPLKPNFQSKTLQSENSKRPPKPEVAHL